MREYYAVEALRLDAELLESPLRISGSELAFVDIPSGRVFRMRNGRVEETVEIGQPVGAVLRHADGGLWVAMRDGIARLGPEGAELVIPVEIENADNQMNDAQADPAGRIWAGTVAADERPGAGTLYRIGVDHSVTAVRPGTTISNGMAWNAAATRMYYIDSPTHEVTGYDFDSALGEARNPRPLIVIDDGLPDGMTIDAADNLWVAIWGTGQVRWIAPDGTLLGVVHVPTPFVTSCAFGGEDLQTLFITSAAESPEGHSSAVYSCRVEQPGRVPHRVRLQT